MNAAEALHAQIHDLLNAMSVLSEAQTAKLDAEPGKSDGGHKILRHNGPPLHDIWLSKFTLNIGNYSELERLLAAGKAALALRRHGPPKIHDSVESADFILSNYEGVDSRTVALIESERGAHCHPDYVTWLRRRNDYSDMGYPKEPSDRRVRLAVSLYEETRVSTGRGNQAKVAEAMGVSQQTVSRLLDQAKMAA